MLSVNRTANRYEPVKHADEDEVYEKIFILSVTMDVLDTEW